MIGSNPFLVRVAFLREQKEQVTVAMDDLNQFLSDLPNLMEV